MAIYQIRQDHQIILYSLSSLVLNVMLELASPTSTVSAETTTPYSVMGLSPVTLADVCNVVMFNADSPRLPVNETIYLLITPLGNCGGLHVISMYVDAISSMDTFVGTLGAIKGENSIYIGN